MSNQPKKAWVEAASVAAELTYEALGSMNTGSLDLKAVDPKNATGTNSRDIAFLDFISEGSHLTERFLANAH